MYSRFYFEANRHHYMRMYTNFGRFSFDLALQEIRPFVHLENVKMFLKNVISNDRFFKKTFVNSHLLYSSVC